jgi:autotransporter-associated beta strand protein
LNTGGNSFTGPVVINAGTLSVTNLANGGSPSALGASSASPTNLVLNGGALSYGGAPVKSNRGFLIAATNSTIDAEGNLTLGGQVTNVANPFEAGASAFTKSGPAQLTLTGSGDQEFSRGYQAGINIVAGTLVLDGSAGNQTNHTQNEFWVGSTPNSGAALILTNTTLHVDSWLGLARVNGGINNTSSLALYNSAMTVGNLSVGWDGNQPGNLASQFVTLNGNSTLTNYGAVNLPEGSGSTMLMSVNGNSVFWVQNPVYLALAANSTATLVVSNSGQIVQPSGYFDIAQGQSSVASVLLKNNASVSTFSDFNLADTGSGAIASFTAQDSSALHANNIYVGKAASSVGTLTISNSATVVSANGVSLVSGTGATGTVNLSGGSLAANLVQGTTDPTAISTFNFNGGTLVAHGPLVTPKFMFNLSAINILAGGAVIDTESNSITIAQPLLGSSGNGGLTKVGVGTLNLNGANTYRGTTLVSDGTLSGSGSVAGPVTIGANGLIEPGFLGIGTFTINNTLTFDADSTAFFKIGATNYDEIAGLTHVTYGGSLVVTNTTGYPLVIGNTYQLFHSASAGVGNFTSVSILPNGVGIFNPTNGVLTIIPGGPLAIYPPVISGNELIFAGTGGTPGKTYSILTSTNLTAPLSTWTTNFTGVFNSSGVFSNGISIRTNDTGVAHVFRLKLP